MKNIDIFTVAKDENTILIEWINHYLALNINHIYIFDDNSKINYKEIINEKYQEKVSIFTIDCNFYDIKFKKSIYYSDEFYNVDEISKQMYFLNYFVKYLYSNKKDNWILHCDVDEFLYLKDTNFLKNTIKRYNNCNKIFIPWIIYGTSYTVNHNINKSIKDTYKMHCNSYSHLYKCIFKPQQLDNRIANNPHFINLNPTDNIYIVGYNKLLTINEIINFFNNFYDFEYNLWKYYKINSLDAHFNHYQFLSVKNFIERKIFRIRCAESLWKINNRNLWLENNKCIRYLHDYIFNESDNDNNSFLPILNYNTDKNTLYEMMDYKNLNIMTIDKYKDMLNSNDLRYWEYDDLKSFLIKNNYFNNEWDILLKKKDKIDILYNLYYLINKEYIN